MPPQPTAYELQVIYLARLLEIMEHLDAATELELLEQGLVVADCGALLDEAQRQFLLGIWARPAPYQTRSRALAKMRTTTETALAACGLLGTLTLLEFTHRQANRAAWALVQPALPALDPAAGEICAI